MRVSSATRPSFIGTLKSTRTRAVLPAQSTSRMVQRRGTLLFAGHGARRRCGRVAAQARVLAPPTRVAHDLLQDRAVGRGAPVQFARHEGGYVRQAAGVSKF